MLPKQQHFLYGKSMNCNVPVTACKYGNNAFTKEFSQITNTSAIDSATPNFFYIVVLYIDSCTYRDGHTQERKKASFR